MLNTGGFIKKSMPQPLYYQLVFGGWCAVYNVSGNEYHIQLNPEYTEPKEARSVSVLAQHSNGRTELSEHKTIKAAVQSLENIMKKAEV